MPVVPETMSAIHDVMLSLNVAVRTLPHPADVRDDADFARFWDMATAQVGRRTLPLEVGLAMPEGRMGVIDYLAASAATVGDALRHARDLFPTVSPGTQLLLEEVPPLGWRVALSNWPVEPGAVHADLLTLGILVSRLRTLTPEPGLQDLHLTLATPTDDERTRITSLLGQRPVFGAHRTRFRLSTRVWMRQLPSHDPALARTLRPLAGLPGTDVDSTLQAVRALLFTGLPSMPSIVEAARALGMSRRTLQRRLAQAGTSYRRQQDDVRRVTTEHLLATASLTLAQVASRVGYSDPATFTRACVRWFGAPPSTLRRQRLQNG